MGNVFIIILLKEQNIALYNFQNSMEIIHQKTLEAGIECITLIDDGLEAILIFS